MQSTGIVCVLNGSANSDQAKAAYQAVADGFAARGVDARIHIAESGDDLMRHARSALAGGASVVVAGGGDGTLNAVASVLVDTGVAMGVLPMGTLNHFAKDMNIPLDMEKAIDTVLAGRTSRIDVGQVNDRIFLNNASLGLYPRIVRAREALQRTGWGKWLAFIRASLITLWRYVPLHVHLKAPVQSDAREKTPFVFIGNNEYLVDGPNLGQRKRLDAGRLWVYRSAQTTHFQLLGLLLGQLTGAPRGRQLTVFDTHELQADVAGSHIEVAFDGEVTRMATPLTFRIRPAALAVIVPEPAD